MKAIVEFWGLSNFHYTIIPIIITKGINIICLVYDICIIIVHINIVAHYEPF